MAMTEVPQAWNYHDFIRVDFPNTLVPSEADNDAFCQVLRLNKTTLAFSKIIELHQIIQQQFSIMSAFLFTYLFNSFNLVQIIYKTNLTEALR